MEYVFINVVRKNPLFIFASVKVVVENIFFVASVNIYSMITQNYIIQLLWYTGLL